MVTKNVIIKKIMNILTKINENKVFEKCKLKVTVKVTSD